MDKFLKFKQTVFPILMLGFSNTLFAATIGNIYTVGTGSSYHYNKIQDVIDDLELNGEYGSIVVRNMQGKAVLIGRDNFIDTSSLSPGSYQLVIKNNSILQTVKFKIK